MSVDKLKISYGGIKFKEEIGSLENSHLVVSILLHWQCAQRGGIVFE